MREDRYLDLLAKCLVGYFYPESSNLEIRPHGSMSLPKRRLLGALNRRGYKLYKAQKFDPEARQTGTD